MSSTLSSSLDSDLTIVSGQSDQSSSKQGKTIFAISLGNGLEMYDFTVYSFFAVIIGELFFNVSGAGAGLLLSLATFGVGFVMRPLGAVLIGNYADKHGRKAALTLTIALMTIGTGMIALTPTYESIGIAATIILVVGRLLQGLSAGGEIGAASAALMESDNYKCRCYMVSWQLASQGAAALFGALIGFAVNGWLTPEDVHSWGWRIPFILGLLIGPVGWYIRRHLKESHEPDTHAKDTPFKTVLRKQGRTVLIGMLMIWGATACMYIEVFYMPTYLIKDLGYAPTTAFAVAVMVGFMLMMLMPVMGKWADRLQSRKTLPLLGMLSSFALIFPAFALLSGEPSLPKALLIIGGLITLFAMANASLLVLIMEAFTQQYRASGISMIYGFGVTVFGGFTPLFVASLIEFSGNKMAPAFYLMTALIVSALAIWRFPTKAPQ